MKVLFATTNPAKVNKYKSKLEEKGIDLITINDLDFKCDVHENGKNAIENAYIKAKTYYDKLKIPTIGIDNSLFIENLPEDKQPGTFVRRVNGKELTDEEVIEHYINLVKENGSKLSVKWVNGMVICSDRGVKEYSWANDSFYFVDKPCQKRTKGYPLDSISIVPGANKYLAELTEEEVRKLKKNDNTDEIVNFIINEI